MYRTSVTLWSRPRCSEAIMDSTRGDQEEEALHQTILGGNSLTSLSSITLQRCLLPDCCDNRVHCPFCDIHKYKPSQPARVRDHIHLTHFQHAVYYDGLMVVKCFHSCRSSDTRGGHYHCPMCGTTLLKRNAFTNHLHSHAARQGLDSSSVQAPDAKRPAVIYYDEHKIELCQMRCPDTPEPHFHCPLCRRNFDQLTSLMGHVWRCKKKTISIAAKGDSTGYSLDIAKLFSPDIARATLHLKDCQEYKWHLSMVRNLSDLPLRRCVLPDCCKGKYHCPLCTTSKLKPNHLCHMKQHFVSHWRSGVQFKAYTVLVCYLPCELARGLDRIRFHYHCPLCGATRRRREGFVRHLRVCNSSEPNAEGQRTETEGEGEEEAMVEAEVELASPSTALIPLPDSGVRSLSPATPMLSTDTTAAQSSTVGSVRADQVELQAAQSLANMDHRILMESLHKNITSCSSSAEMAASPRPVESSHTPHDSDDRLLRDSLHQPCGEVPESCHDQSLEDASVNAKYKTMSIPVVSSISQDDQNAAFGILASKNSNNATVGLPVSKNNHEIYGISDEKFSEDGSSVVGSPTLKHSVNICRSSIEASNKESLQGTISSSEHPATHSTDQDQSNVDEITTSQSKESSTDKQDRFGSVRLNCMTLSDSVVLNLRSQKNSTSSVAKQISVGRGHQRAGQAICKTKNGAPSNGNTKYGPGAIEVKDKGDNGCSSIADNIQIFEDVTTQISDGIVSELKRREELEESLSAIGRVCKVAWQRSDASVTMACDLSELHHVQNCLKMILKEGVQNFAQSPPPRLTTPSDTHLPSTLPPLSAPLPPPQTTSKSTAAKSGRKRGRPRGSQKKLVLTVNEEDEHHNNDDKIKKPRIGSVQKKTGVPVHREIKEDDSETPAVVAGYVKETSDDVWDRGNSSVLHIQNSCTEHSASEKSGQYAGRTRGRKINFAQLNAGSVTPAHKDVSPTSKSSLCHSVTAPAMLKNFKRGRGRPSKVAPVELELSSVSVSQKKLQRSVTDSVLEMNGLNKSIDDVNSGNTDSKHDSRKHHFDVRDDVEIMRKKSAMSEGFDADKPSETRVAVCAKKLMKSTGSASNLQIIVCEVPEAANKEKQPPQNNGKSQIGLQKPGTKGGQLGKEARNENGKNFVSEVRKQLISKQNEELSLHCNEKLCIKYDTDLQNERRINARDKNGRVPDKDLRSTKCRNDEEDDQEQNMQTEYKSKSLVISGRKANMYKNQRGVADFAVIPKIIFNFAANQVTEDAEMQHHEPLQPEEDLSAECFSASEICDNVVLSATQQMEQERADVDEEKDAGKDRDVGTDTLSTFSQVEGQFRCPVCKTTFDSYSVLSRHISSLHPDRAAVVCDVCEIVCPTSGALNLHLERRHGPKPEHMASAAFSCKVCNKECNSASTLRWHHRLVHKQGNRAINNKATPRLKCVLCNYTAVDSWDMRHHRELHRGQPATCTVCRKTLSSEAALKVHMMAKHVSETFTCHICNKSFAHMRYLRSHLQRHGGEKRHVCTICGWAFYHTNSLRTHMDTHKPRAQRTYTFKCPHCPAAYNRQANFKDHLNKHTGEKPHVCGQCGRGFAFRSMLTTHVVFKHNSDRPHCCTECHKRYKTKTQLRQHQMSHTMARTGTSPFICSKCNRPMASKSRLHAHLKRCKGDKNVKQVVWQQRLMNPAEENRLQAVELVSHQPLNLQVPLVNLLQEGQQFNIIHHGLGSEATFTLVPVQNSASLSSTGLMSDDNRKSLLAPPQGTLAACDNDDDDDHDLKQECFPSQQKMVSSQTLNVKNDGVVSDAGDQTQMVFIQNIASSPPNSSAVNSGKCPELDISGNIQLIGHGGQQKVFVQNRDVGMPSNEVESETGNQLSDYQSQNPQDLVLHENSQSESLLQAPASSQQLVLSDEFGNTQTIILPAEFLKQEVVVIENEDGQQNILDLSKVQIVNSDAVVSQSPIQLMDSDPQQLHSGDNQDMEMFHAPAQIVGDTETSEVGASSSSVTESYSLVDRVGDGMETEASVFVCSMCNQQFDSMALARQHVLLDHSLDGPVSTDLDSDGVVL